MNGWQRMFVACVFALVLGALAWFGKLTPEVLDFAEKSGLAGGALAALRWLRYLPPPDGSAKPTPPASSARAPLDSKPGDTVPAPTPYPSGADDQ
jgi:hypothetical protein